MESFLDDNKKRYDKEIRSIELLSREQELALFKKIREGDQKARETLIKSNLRFVRSTASKYSKNGIQESDLIEAGNIGLIQAINTFDETRGFRFLTHAGNSIRKFILEFITQSDRFLYLPENKERLKEKVKKARDKLFGKLERDPQADEIAEYLGESERDIAHILPLVDSEKSLDLPQVDSKGKVFRFHDTTAETDMLGINERLINEEESGYLENFLKILTPQQEKVIRLWMQEERSLEEISLVVGVSKERVRQLREAAIKKLSEKIVKNRSVDFFI